MELHLHKKRWVDQSEKVIATLSLLDFRCAVRDCIHLATQILEQTKSNHFQTKFPSVLLQLIGDFVDNKNRRMWKSVCKSWNAGIQVGVPLVDSIQHVTTIDMLPDRDGPSILPLDAVSFRNIEKNRGSANLWKQETLGLKRQLPLARKQDYIDFHASTCLHSESWRIFVVFLPPGGYTFHLWQLLPECKSKGQFRLQGFHHWGLHKSTFYATKNLSCDSTNGTIIIYRDLNQFSPTERQRCWQCFQVPHTFFRGNVSWKDLFFYYCHKRNEIYRDDGVLVVSSQKSDIDSFVVDDSEEFLFLLQGDLITFRSLLHDTVLAQWKTGIPFRYGTGLRLWKHQDVFVESPEAVQIFHIVLHSRQPPSAHMAFCWSCGMRKKTRQCSHISDQVVCADITIEEEQCTTRICTCVKACEECGGYFCGLHSGSTTHCLVCSSRILETLENMY